MSAPATDPAAHSRPRRSRPTAREVLDALVAPPQEGSSLRSKLLAVPLHLWLLLLGLTAALSTGWAGEMGLPVSLDRLLLPMALALLAFDGTRPRQRTTVVHVLAFVFVTWIVVDMILRGMVTDSGAVFALADRVVLPFVILLVAPLVFTTDFRRRILLVWLTVIGAYLGVTAVLEMFAPGLVVPGYITNLAIGEHPGRARGPMMAGDAMGVSCLAIAAAAGALAWSSRGLTRWLATAVVALDLVAVVLSQTRAVWLAAVVAVVLVFVLVPATRRWIPAVTAAGAVAAVATVTALPQLVEQLSGRFEDKGPVYDRLGSNDSALAVIQDLPLTGIGWYRFLPHGSEWYRQSDAYPTNKVVLEIHNVLLSRTAELGLVAAAIFLAFLVLGPGRALWDRRLPRYPGQSAPDARAWRVVAAIAFTGWFVAGLFGPMAIPFPNLVTFLLCGVACGGLLLEDVPQHPTPADRTTEHA